MRKYLLLLLLYPCLVSGQDSITVKVPLGDPTGIAPMGTRFMTLSQPSAVRYIKINADNTLSTRTAAEMLSDIGGQGAGSYVLQSTTVNGHALSSNVSVTAGDVGLGSVENTALSTWAGTANITTVGTIGTGTWNATAIADGKIASALTGKTYNGLTVTSTAGTLTIANNASASLITAGNFALTLTATATTNATFPAGTKTLLATDGSAASLTGFPTFNQNTTGSAATLTTSRKINFQPFNGSADIIDKAIVANTSVITGTAARTITGAQIVAGNIQELTGTVGRTFTFDTGTNMSAACSSVTVGDTYYILIKSSGTSSGTITLAGATGMTLSSSAVIAIGTSRMCAIINTGTNAWTVY